MWRPRPRVKGVASGRLKARGTLNDMAYRWVIVTPVFEDVEAASRLFVELRETLGNEVVVVAVDDGSTHEPLGTEPIRDAGLDGVVVRLIRNIGHQRAIAVGLGYASEHYPDLPCVVMDSDGEDVPASVPLLIDELERSGVDAVVAQRRNRSESWKFQLFYAVYKRIFGALTGRNISFGNFMILKPAAVRRICAMPETWIHLAASVLVSRLRVLRLPIDRGSRYVGSSKMNFTGLALHGFRAITVFAEDVMVRLGAFCAFVGAMSIVGIIASIALKVAGMTSPGWFSVALALLTIMLIQTGALALISLFVTGRSNNLLAVQYSRMIDVVMPVDRE